MCVFDLEESGGACYYLLLMDNLIILFYNTSNASTILNKGTCKVFIRA